MALHHAGENEPRGGDAHLDHAAEAQVQGAVVAIEQILEHRVGRMQEQRHAELLDPGVERLEPLGVDARIAADAARQIGAHQAELVDGVVEHLDGDARVLQRHRGAGPQPARIFALRARHLLVPHQGEVAALIRRQIREGDRERPDRADHVDLMAEPVHVLELLVEIEPLGPAVEMGAGAFAPPVIVAAVVVVRRRAEIPCACTAARTPSAATNGNGNR